MFGNTRSHDTLDNKSEKKNNPANQLYIITKFWPRQVKKYDVIVFITTTFGLGTFFFCFFFTGNKVDCEPANIKFDVWRENMNTPIRK